MSRSISLILLFASFLTFRNNAIAQPTIINDTSFFPTSQILLTEIDNRFHLNKENDFELRVWITFSKTMKRQLFILSHAKNKWTARFFERSIYLADTLLEIRLGQEGLATLWKRLKRRNLLTIPKDYELKDKNGNEIEIPIHDGIAYTFELLSPESKRSYSYHCPKSHHEEYPKVQAFEDIVKLIHLIYKYCKIAPAYIC
jgi:hypothetical protein